MKPPPIDEVSMNAELIMNFQSIIENSDICVIPVNEYCKYNSLSIRRMTKKLLRVDSEEHQLIDKDCLKVLNDVNDCTPRLGNSIIQLYKRTKWLLFIRVDELNLNSSNVLTLGEKEISLKYNDKYNDASIDKFTSIVDLSAPMNQYPDDWSGFVSVWSSYMPFLTIVPKEWHLDVHYID